MESQVATTPDPKALAVIQKKLALTHSMKSGVNWFFWIAGLSLLNTIIYLTGSTLSFVVGLGATQIVDGFTSALAKEFVGGTPAIIQLIGLGVNIFIAGVFAGLGLLAQRRHRWAIVVGMILYTLDGLIFLLVGGLFAVIFHAIALFGLWNGLKATNGLIALEKELAAGNLQIQQSTLSAESQPSPTSKTKLIILAAIVLLPLLALLVFGLMLLPYLK